MVRSTTARAQRSRHGAPRATAGGAGRPRRRRSRARRHTRAWTMRSALDGGDVTPDPRSAWQPHGVHGESRWFDARRAHLARRDLGRAAARGGRARRGGLRAARRDLHPRGHPRRRAAPAAAPGRPRGRRRRADAGGGLAGSLELGLRRRRAVGGRRRVRRAGGAPALRRRLPRLGSRRLPRRRLQPPRAGRATTCRASGPTSPTATTTPWGHGLNLDGPGQPARAALDHRQRAAVVRATSTSTPCASTPCTSSRTTPTSTCSRSSPTRWRR